MVLQTNKILFSFDFFFYLSLNLSLFSTYVQPHKKRTLSSESPVKHDHDPNRKQK